MDFHRELNAKDGEIAKLTSLRSAWEQALASRQEFYERLQADADAARRNDVELLRALAGGRAAV